MEHKKHVRFTGRLVFVGFGSVGQGSLPLLLRHIDMPRERIVIVTADERGRKEAESYGIKFVVRPLTRENHRAVLEPLIGPGDFLLTLSVDVASVALIEFACERGALYLDTCIEPWLGGYTDPNVSPSHRSNYGQREEVLKLRAKFRNGAPTVIPTHGANPGLISHWIKQAMVNIARDIHGEVDVPKTREKWAQLAMKLGIKVIHCAERDTQVPSHHAEKLVALANARRGQPTTRLVVLQGVNHLLVPAETGEVGEYASLAGAAVTPDLAREIAVFLNAAYALR